MSLTCSSVQHAGQVMPSTAVVALPTAMTESETSVTQMVHTENLQNTQVPLANVVDVKSLGLEEEFVKLARLFEAKHRKEIEERERMLIHVTNQLHEVTQQLKDSQTKNQRLQEEIARSKPPVPHSDKSTDTADLSVESSPSNDVARTSTCHNSNAEQTRSRMLAKELAKERARSSTLLLKARNITSENERMQEQLSDALKQAAIVDGMQKFVAESEAKLNAMKVSIALKGDMFT